MIIDDKEYLVKIDDKTFHCAMDVTMSVIGGKWKTVILWYLIDSKKRFKDLKRLIPNITEKMLISTLRELEKDTLVKREIYAEVPPRVDYSLTDFGRELVPLLNEIAKWGREHATKKGKIIDVSTGETVNKLEIN